MFDSQSGGEHSHGPIQGEINETYGGVGQPWDSFVPNRLQRQNGESALLYHKLGDVDSVEQDAAVEQDDAVEQNYAVEQDAPGKIKPKSKPKSKRIYFIIIFIFLIGIGVLLYFLFTGSENLDDTIKKAEDQILESNIQINKLRAIVQQDIASLNTSHNTAETDMTNLSNAHDMTTVDLRDYGNASQLADQKQNLLSTTLNNIAAAAHALGDAIATRTT